METIIGDMPLRIALMSWGSVEAIDAWLLRPCCPFCPPLLLAFARPSNTLVGVGCIQASLGRWIPVVAFAALFGVGFGFCSVSACDPVLAASP